MEEVTKKEEVKTGMVLPEEKTYADLLDEFTHKTGMTREQARKWLVQKMLEAGVNPYKDMEEAMRWAEKLKTVIELFPDLPLTSKVKDVVSASSLAGVSVQAQSVEGRIEKMMERMMPYIVMARILPAMMGGSDSDPKLARLEAQLESLSKELERRPIEELRQEIARMKEELSGRRGPVEEKLEELKRTFVEQQKTKELEELRNKLDDTMEQLSSRIDSLQAMMGRGEPKSNVLAEATQILSAIGDFYRGFGEVAKSLGYEPKDEKLAGDRWDKMMSLAKKGIEVFADALRYSGVPPKRKIREMEVPREVVDTTAQPEATVSETIKPEDTVTLGSQ